MLGVNIRIGAFKKTIFTFEEEGVTANEVGRKVTELTGIASSEFYIVHNGRLYRNSDNIENGTAEIVPRLFGGKGGFGSMLRAIGAQIEKTTNREACRDLSGRRLRDINEEKRLKSWIDKQATREEEAVERKKKKLERLCAQPKHEFKDKNYEKERSTLTEKVGDAVDQGFKLSMTAGSSGIKRKQKDDKVNGGRKRLALDSDIDSDELGSSSDESESDIKAEACSTSTQKLQDNNKIESRSVEGEDSGGLQKFQTPVEETEISHPVNDQKDSECPVVDKSIEGVAVM